VSCEIAATCLCRGDLPADGVLEATITAAFQAQVTAVHGNAGAFAVGDTICVDQSVVGASILVPVKSDSDAAQVVLPPPDGGTCVPSYAYTVLLDDGGRPLACNDGVESQLSLDTQQSTLALMASDCTAALAKSDSRWSGSSCAPSGGCATTFTSPSAAGALMTLTFLSVLVVLRSGSSRRRTHEREATAEREVSYRRAPSRGSFARRAGTE